MPSPDGRGRDWAALLRSQGLGLCCGFATVALLAVGSFVLAATREGASAGIAGDDLRAFFERPALAHLWFYALVGVLGLYLVNTALATWHSVTRKLRAGVRSPSRYAAALVHVAFLLALVAHGAGGLWGGERGEAVIARGAWAALPGGPEARLLSLAVERLPGGMPKEVRAEVELRHAGGTGGEERVTVGYNQPISSGLGADLHLLAEMGQVGVAEISLGEQRCAALLGRSCRLADLDVTVVSASEAGRMGPRALAQLRVDRSGAAPQVLWLTEGREAPVADGRPLRLESLAAQPAILVRSRSAPGNPWALFSALAIALGVALLWRRFLPRSRPEEDETG